MFGSGKLEGNTGEKNREEKYKLRKNGRKIKIELIPTYYLLAFFSFPRTKHNLITSLML